MTIEMPDLPAADRFTPEELRLELACALFARGRLGKIAASKMAGVDFFTFQCALGDRQIESVTEKMLEEDVATLKKLFPQ